MDIRKRAEWAKMWIDLGRQRTNAAWALRHAKSVGEWPTVGGHPKIDATDLEVGDHVKIWQGHRQTLITGWGPIRIGNRVFINSGTVIFAVVGITIGDDVALANEVYLTDTNSHGIAGAPAVEAPITIGSGTWVGARAMILPGVTIGKRVLVGAGAVVTGDVPDDVLVAGNPARVIRSLDYPAYCRRAWHDAFCPCPKPAPDEPAAS